MKIKIMPVFMPLIAAWSSTKTSSSSKSSSSPHIVELPIFRLNNGFVAEIGVGTPPQKMNLTIDTGSSFTWIRIPGDEVLGHTGNGTAALFAEHESFSQIFDPSASSSFKSQTEKQPFTAVRNQHYVQGYQGSESMIVNNVTVPKLQITMVQNSTMDVNGVLGIGFSSEVPGQSKKGKKSAKTNTLLDRMAKEGKIRHKAYSLHLDGGDAETGSIMLGGRDTDKFVGLMKELPIAPHRDFEGRKSYQSMQIMMTGLDLGKRSLAFNHAAILDPSTRISYLPKGVFEPVIEFLQNSRLNGSQDAIIKSEQEGQMVQFVDCTIQETLFKKSVTFGFGGLEGAKIEIPIRSLIRKVPGCKEGNTNSTSGKDVAPLMDEHCACYLAIQQYPATGSFNSTEIMVLGDAILRHASIVYDLQNNNIGMAQRNFNSNKSNIVEFGKKMKSIPGTQQMKEQKGSAAARFGVLGPVDPVMAFWTLMVLFGGMVAFA
ncbi:hypothetical protein VTL71DRAFT_3503 [Oculimacula yallundae]|uniref:Peptidase A1 domain-containing protein n=1 Tax=Oculimacula yallundae TaxID=86028 RepID=A0ABR4C7D1_9HELO